jgi:hypothetical protein
MRILNAARYVMPLREGGSLPAVVEADDGELYVMKFVGAGQGQKALIAELLAGEIGRALGLDVPEIVLLTLDPDLGRSEPNPEIQDLLRASTGLNLGLRYLPNAFAFNQLLTPPPASELASTIVWFDAYTTNVDRTARNVNMLLWQGKLWLIDHGAAIYFHFDWSNYLERARSPFSMIRQHTLLPFANDLRAADAAAHQKLDGAQLKAIVAQIPEQWLGDEAIFADTAAHRDAYVEYLCQRLDASALFVEEAIHAHTLYV